MELTIFLIQSLLPLAIGTLVAACSHTTLHRLLVDLCQTEVRAEFWSRTITLTLMLTPLFMSLAWLTPHADGSLVLAIRTTLATSVGGTLAALAIVSRVVWRQIRASDANAHEPTGGEAA